MKPFALEEVRLDHCQDIGEDQILLTNSLNAYLVKLACKNFKITLDRGMIEPKNEPTGECENGYKGILCSECES